MMKISWDTKHLGTFHMEVEDSDVLDRIEQLSRLGFTASVDIVDEN
jgi:hypothetical protein